MGTGWLTHQEACRVRLRRFLVTLWILLCRFNFWISSITLGVHVDELVVVSSLGKVCFLNEPLALALGGNLVLSQRLLSEDLLSYIPLESASNLNQSSFTCNPVLHILWNIWNGICNGTLDNHECMFTNLTSLKLSTAMNRCPITRNPHTLVSGVY